ncbi:sodium:solute symporter family protein [Mariniblastus fucicola]|uniref:Sodium/proline symporter n=1 Tax=Mariniblastus fucicola TaxID=980251 RepID=A0A5B9PHP8_9BACT|nr:sodium:solute symporter family protein [Mariniblastus fucicola]QEG24192.1 Sodium/proline symporter [Mariniblastus fucicola]
MELLLAETNAGLVRLGVITVYLLALLLLGYFASRMFSGTRNDYLLASHSIGPFLLLMSIFGTTMTAFALVGSSGASFKEGIGVYGMLASSSGIVHSLCFFMIGVKIYGFGRKYGYSTQCQFFRDRLESDLVGLLLFPILVAMVIPYLLIGVMSGGIVIEAMTTGALPGIFPSDGPMNGAVPRWLGSAVVCAVVLTYVFFGGMRGTAWANAAQTMIFMVLGVVTFVVLANKIGGGETFLQSLQNASSKVSYDFTTRSRMSPSKFCTYMLIPLSVGMFPHLFQHWLTAKSAKSFKLSVVMHPIFILIVWVPCVLIGIWGTAAIADPSLIPPPVAEVLKAPDGANKILPILVKLNTSAWLGGLLTAGILAAIMSSLDSQFLCIGSMFTNDVVTHYLGEERFSDRAQVWIARVFIILIVVITYIFAQYSWDVFVLGVWCFSGFAALFPIIFAALYWKRLTAAGAVSGILAAAGSWYLLFQESKFGADRGYALTIPGTELQIMPVVAIFACTLLAMVVTSFVTKMPSKETLDRFFPEKV